jgi:heme exporter protein B
VTTLGAAGRGQAWAVLRRELAVQRASREALVTVPPFVLAAVLLVGLGAGARLDALRVVSPALTWLLVLSAGVVLARAVRAAEQEDDAWDLLRALVRPGALLAGKLAALWLQLAATWAVAALLAAAALGASWRLAGLAGGALGTLGVAADLVVVGVLLGGTARRAGLLGVLVLAAGVPVLLAGTSAATAGDPVPWLVLLAVHDVLAVTLASALVPVLLEE